MARKRHSDGDILKLLREIELKLTSGDDVCIGVSERRDQRCDVLQLAEAVWRDGPVSAVGDEESGERERAAEEDRRGARTGQAHHQGKPEPPKAQGLTTEELRQAVIHTRQKLAMSERRTCRVIGQARSSLQYRPVPRDDDALRLALIRLAKQYGRYGYRKVTELLHIEGWQVNHKKVERLWREEGLQLPQRQKKRKRLYHQDSSIIRMRPTHPNHVWAIDFVHDKLSNGRSYKMLTVLDEFTRQALAVTVRNKMGADDVLEALYPLLLRHGSPEYIRSDNGPEFAAEAMQGWLRHIGIKPIRIYPGSPWENGYNERFNGTLRREGS